MNNIIEDVAALTTIPKLSLEKLCEKVEWSICDSLIEENMKGNNPATIDIGFGKLIIADLDNCVKYKFIPNSRFDDNVKAALDEHKNNIPDRLEKKLVYKIINTYKDLI